MDFIALPRTGPATHPVSNHGETQVNSHGPPPENTLGYDALPEAISDDIAKRLYDQGDLASLSSLRATHRAAKTSIDRAASSLAITRPGPPAGRWPHVRSLAFSGAARRDLKDENLKEILAACPCVDHLDLRGCNGLTPGALAIIAKATPLLRHLDLRACGTGAGGIAELERHKASFSELRALGVGDKSDRPCLSDGGVTAIARTFPKLEHLDLQDNRRGIGDGTMSLIAEKLSNLRHLEIDGGLAITDQGIVTLANSLTKLTSLQLRNFLRATENAVSSIFDGAWPLESLRLEDFGSGMSRAECEPGKALSRVTSFALQNIPVSSENLQRFADTMPRLKRLELILSLKTLTDEDVTGLAKRLPNLVSLKLVPLSGSGVGDKGIRELANGTPNLAHLHVSSYSGPVNENIGSSIAHLQNLKSLSLPESRISAADLQAVAAKLTKLEQLDLYMCTDLADEHLEAIGNAHSLRRLNLQLAHPFTDEGLKSIAKLPNLVMINLNDCAQLSDAGVAHLADAAKLLEEIHIAGNPGFRSDGCPRVTDAGIAKIAENLRRLKLLEVGGSYRSAPENTEPGLTSAGYFERKNSPVTATGLTALLDCSAPTPSVPASAVRNIRVIHHDGSRRNELTSL